jgi:hypothetical protein
VAPGETLLSVGQSLMWHPEADANGTLPAFTVSAWDDATSSAAEVQAFVSVAAVNDPPTMTRVNFFTEVRSDQDLEITYDMLARAADASDVDGDAIRFLVSRINSGTLMKDGVPAVEGTTYLAAGESLVWHPAPGSAGTMNLFNVQAWDGQALSALPLSVRAILDLKGDANRDGAVNIFDVAKLQQYYGTTSGMTVAQGDFDGDGDVDIFDVALLQTNYGRSAGNDAPTLSAISPLEGAVDNEDYAITYTMLAAAANEADINSDPLAFRIEALDAGILMKDEQTVVPGTTLLAEGESLVWRSAPNSLGRISAFSVSVWDGEFASTPAVAVEIEVTEVTLRVVAMAPKPEAAVGSGVGSLVASFSQPLDPVTVIAPSSQILGSRGDGTFPAETVGAVAKSPAGSEPEPLAEAAPADFAPGALDPDKTPLDLASLDKAEAMAPVAPWTRRLLDEAVFAPFAASLARRRGRLPASLLGFEPASRNLHAAESGWEMAVDQLFASTQFDPTGLEDGAVP